jgi:ABC-type Fe3+-hydroxamate transport system substrate-binding protein
MAAHPPEAPRRIVSLVPSTTETLFALGLGEQVVGVTDFCIRPEEMPAHVVRVGGTKTPDLAAIRRLAPDLVLANREENRREDVAALAQFTDVDVAFPLTVADAVADLRRLGALLGVAAAAEELAAAIEERAAAVRRAARPFRFAYLVWRRPWMAAGRGTFVDGLLALGGGANVLGEAEGRYPRVELSELAAREPAVVFLPDEPYPFTAAHVDELAQGMGPAFYGRCRLVSGDDYCWHGVRLVEGLADYASWLASRPVAV